MPNAQLNIDGMVAQVGLATPKKKKILPNDAPLVELNVAAKKPDPYIPINNVAEFKAAVAIGICLEYQIEEDYWRNIRLDKDWTDGSITKFLNEHKIRKNKKLNATLVRAVEVKGWNGQPAVILLQACNFTKLVALWEQPSVLKKFGETITCYIEGENVV